MKIFNYSPKVVGGLYLFLILFFGSIYWLFPCFWKEPLSFIQSIYFSVVTITTLGYGDILPITNAAMIFTAIESLLGILLIGLFLNSLAHKYSEREKELETYLENERWKPARLLVARHICRVHQMLFHSLKWVVDPDFHTDLKSHSLPANFTQRQADGWAKEQQIKHLPYHFDELKKMIEYNNVALDSSLHPKTISFIVAAKDILGTCEFIVSSYNGTGQWQGSFNYQAAFEMDSIYTDMLQMFPEISELEKPASAPPISANEMLELVKLSNEKCHHVKLSIKET